MKYPIRPTKLQSILIKISTSITIIVLALILNQEWVIASLLLLISHLSLGLALLLGMRINASNIAKMNKDIDDYLQSLE